jgi:hypothetical protein
LVVTGEVTEFSEKKVRILGIENNKVTVGFVLKVLNAQTGAILFSESVNGEATQNGYSGGRLFGVPVVAGSSLSGAVGQAVEEAIIKAVEILADKKDKIEAPIVKPKTFDAASCMMLRNGRGPKIMILIPEAQTLGGTVNNEIAQNQQNLERTRLETQKEGLLLLRDVFRSGRDKSQAQAQQQQTTTANAVKKTVEIEQAIAENIIIKRFIEAGFRVIDPKVYGKLRKQTDSLNDDQARLAALGLKMGANIIITGYAVSERVPNNEGLFAFRGAIQLRAITTDDASILASHTLQAGGVDLAESVASNKSLRNAAYSMSNYMLEQLCKRNLSFEDNGSAKPGGASLAAKVSGGNGGSQTSVALVLSNVNFTQMQAIMTHLKSNPKVKDVRKTLNGKNGRMDIDTSLNPDQIAELVSACKTVSLEITGLEGDRIEVVVK